MAEFREWSEELANALVAGFDLGPGLAMERQLPGANGNFLLRSDAGRFVLRRSSWRKTQESLAFELRVLGFLESTGYPSPRVVPTRAGDGFLVHGDYACIVTRYIPATRPFRYESESDVREAGRILGWFHRVIRGLPGPHLDGTIPGVLDLGGRAPAFDAAPLREFAASRLAAEDRRGVEANLSFLEAQVRSLRGALAKAQPFLTRQVVNGSYGPSSLLFDGTRAVGVVDFDRASFGLRGIDLAYALKAFFRMRNVDGVPYWTRLDSAKWPFFLDGYRAEDELPEPELEAIPALLREMRTMKAVKKCNNFVRKLSEKELEPRKLTELSEFLTQEVQRISWVEDSTNELVEALGASP